jgi:hypothetical protein
MQVSKETRVENVWNHLTRGMLGDKVAEVIQDEDRKLGDAVRNKYTLTDT